MSAVVKAVVLNEYFAASLPVSVSPEPDTALKVPAFGSEKAADAPVNEHWTLGVPTMPTMVHPVIAAVVVPLYGRFAAVIAIVTFVWAVAVYDREELTLAE